MLLVLSSNKERHIGQFQWWISCLGPWTIAAVNPLRCRELLSLARNERLVKYIYIVYLTVCARDHSMILAVARLLAASTLLASANAVSSSVMEPVHPATSTHGAASVCK